MVSMSDRQLSRRAVLGLGVGATAAGLAGCAGSSTSGTGGGSGPTVNFLSTQFTPIEERQRFTQILKDKVSGASVAYNPVEAGVFSTTLQSQVSAGKVSIGLAGGLHGDLAPHASRLTDLDDLLGQLGDRKFSDQVLTLAKLGGSTTKYIPWMQASYVLAVNKKALSWLPAGADVNKLTYDQLLQWVTAAKNDGGKPVFGLPAGPKGLYHRFLQGYLLPSFTGGQISTFRSPEAVAGWEYMKQLWAATAPASTNYDFMQEPLQRGEVLIAWDHVARLIGAPAAKPDDWIMVPAPSGPKGLGYLLIVAGIGIPNGAPDPAAARTVIKALTTPDVQAEVLKQNAFFPVVGDAPTPSGLPPAVALAAGAIGAQRAASNAILALPPVGIGTRDGEVSQIFKNTFNEICLNGKAIQTVLNTGAGQLNAILDQVKVPCWAPDEVVAGQSCRVP
jgi:multiple sugar transport system substrate-binding protein